MKQSWRNPWLGLSSYQEGETIYGRSEEIVSLCHSILANTQTVLYGRSGIGKTSILNAGVFPEVRKRGVFPISIRLEHNSTPYNTQIARAVFNALDRLRYDEYDNYGHKVVSFERGSYNERVKCIAREGDESLWEFFHRHEFFDARGERIKPLIVFDQFEEIFTLEKDSAKVRKFFSEMADLLNDVIPDYINNATDDYANAEKGNLTSDSNGFIEISYASPTNQYEDYLTASEFHVAITLREDYLSYLERESTNIPALKQNRYCLQGINEEQAAIIIMSPIRGLVSSEVAKLIIEKVTGQKDFELDGRPEISVDSAILSLYMNRLFERMSDSDVCISPELVNSESDSIISDFYFDAIAEFPDSIIEYLEDTLVNGDGRRENVSVYSAKYNGHISEKDLTVLVKDKKLLRLFDYGGGSRIEYIHDVLCPVITRHKEQRQALKEQLQLEKHNKEEAERIEKEKKLIKQKRKRNTIFTVILSVFAIGLLFSMIGSLQLRSEITSKSNRIEDLRQDIKHLLPIAVSHKVDAGETEDAIGLLCRFIEPDSLYIPGDSTQISLLRRFTSSYARSLHGHSQAINTVAFSPDGRHAASGSDDMSIIIWDLQNGDTLGVYQDNKGKILSLCYNPNGDRLIASTQYGYLDLFSINDTSISINKTVSIQDYTEDQKSDDYARCVKYNPQGTEIAISISGGRVLFVNATDLSPIPKKHIIKAIDANGKVVTHISYNKYGDLIAFASSDTTIRIFDARSRSQISMPYKKHTDWVRSVEFNPDPHKKSFITCSDDGALRLWNIGNPDNSMVIDSVPSWCTMAKYSPDGERIYLSAKDGMIRVYDANNSSTFRERTEFRIDYPGSISSFDISPDGKQIIAGTSDPFVHLWNLEGSLTSYLKIPSLELSVTGVEVFNDTTLFAAIATDNTAKNRGSKLGVWDYNTGNEVFCVRKYDKRCFQSLSVSPNNSLIAVSSRGTVYLYDCTRGDELSSYSKHKWTINSLCFSHDGRSLVSADTKGNILLWDVKNDSLHYRTSFGVGDGPCSIDFRHDNRAIAIGFRDGSIGQWDILDCKQINTLNAPHHSRITRVRYSADDSSIISSSKDKTACLLSTNDTLKVMKRYVGASEGVNDIIFGITEEEVITASSDNLIRIWGAAEELENAKLKGHSGGATRISIAKNGTLISADAQGSIIVWKVPSLSSIADTIRQRQKVLFLNK